MQASLNGPSSQIATVMADGSVQIWNAQNLEGGPVGTVPEPSAPSPRRDSATDDDKQGKGKGKGGRGGDGRGGEGRGGRGGGRGGSNENSKPSGGGNQAQAFARYAAHEPNLLFVAQGLKVRVIDTTPGNIKEIASVHVNPIPSPIICFDVSRDGTSFVAVNSSKRYFETTVTMWKVKGGALGRGGTFKKEWTNKGHDNGKQLWDIVLSPVSCSFYPCISLLTC